ncbi:hypothetical protein HOY80DRAFT_759914 [Tuber brumale]|nr:hypothetical protein HOY80DRAFT_759914 [Tuber brumale]
MKTSLIVSILGAAVMVAAQSGLSDLPNCAIPCAGSAMSGTGTDSATGPTCSPGDIPCACKDQKFISDISSCIRAACTDSADIQKAASVAQTLCGTNLPSGAISSIQASPTGNTTTSGGNGTKTSTGGGSGGSSGSTTGSSGAKTGSAAGLVPGGFAVAAIFAGLLVL